MPRGMNMHVTADDAVELRQLMDVADREFELPPANENNKTDPEYERDLAVLRATFGAAEPAHTTTWKDGR